MQQKDFLFFQGKLPLLPTTDMASRMLDGAVNLPRQLFGEGSVILAPQEAVQPAKGGRDLVRLFKELKQSVTNDWGGTRPAIIEEDKEFLEKKEKLQDLEHHLSDASQQVGWNPLQHLEFKGGFSRNWQGHNPNCNLKRYKQCRSWVLIYGLSEGCRQRLWWRHSKRWEKWWVSLGWPSSSLPNTRQKQGTHLYMLLKQNVLPPQLLRLVASTGNAMPNLYGTWWGLSLPNLLSSSCICLLQRFQAVCLLLICELWATPSPPEEVTSTNTCIKFVALSIGPARAMNQCFSFLIGYSHAGKLMPELCIFSGWAARVFRAYAGFAHSIHRPLQCPSDSADISVWCGCKQHADWKTGGSVQQSLWWKQDSEPEDQWAQGGSQGHWRSTWPCPERVWLHQGIFLQSGARSPKAWKLFLMLLNSCSWPKGPMSIVKISSQGPQLWVHSMS